MIFTHFLSALVLVLSLIQHFLSIFIIYPSNLLLVLTFVHLLISPQHFTPFFISLIIFQYIQNIFLVSLRMFFMFNFQLVLFDF